MIGFSVLNRAWKFYKTNGLLLFFRRIASSSLITLTSLLLKSRLLSFTFGRRFIFSTIYNLNYWSNNESRSGSGSTLEYTSRIRDFLPKFIRQNQVKVMVDAPCGDFNWMKHVLCEVDIDYRGLDVVKSIISANNSLYGSDQINFAEADLCIDPIPDGDLVLVRDFLFHLSNSDFSRFFKNLKNTQFRFLGFTTYVHGLEQLNCDIPTGSFKNIDLFALPYNFSKDKVFTFIEEPPEDYRRIFCIVKKEDIPNSFEHIA